jgi:hypothetical protein
MNMVWLVMLLALLQYTIFIFMVGRARGRFGVSAPAVTGHEEFERYYRVQMNTVEMLVALIPALGIGAMVLSNEFASAMGAIYLVGRQLYFMSYVKNQSRGLGFVLSFLPIIVLILGSVGMIVKEVVIK